MNQVKKYVPCERRKGTNRPQDPQLQHVQGILDGRFAWVVGWWADERWPLATAFICHAC